MSSPRKLKPTSAGVRGMSLMGTADLTKVAPHKPLLGSWRSTGGRSATTGRVTCRHKGGGHKKRYRLVDFKRNKYNIPAKVETVEYDPNRNCRISLLCYRDGERRYMLHPRGVAVGDVLMSGPEAEIKVGNALPLKLIPLGSVVHNVELYPGRGGQMARSAGTSVQVVAKEGRYVTLRLPSGEMRKVLADCYATLGVVDNEEYANMVIGKAGRARHMGQRPEVRGSAMNPVDHPHGGGEGKAPIGRSSPVTPWGKRALGPKTRNTKKSSQRLIVRSRHSS